MNARAKISPEQRLAVKSLVFLIIRFCASMSS
jgi:hypothetical protein